MWPILILTTLTQMPSSIDGQEFPAKVYEATLRHIDTKIDEMKFALTAMTEHFQDLNNNINYAGAYPTFDLSRKSSSAQRINYARGLTVDEILQREALAQKIEKLFQSDNATKVEAVKQEMSDIIEANFIKMLSAILVTSPLNTQQRTPQILMLMRNVLNKQVDFKPIIDRLPFLIRDTETNQFIILLKALRDSEEGKTARQLGGLEDVGKVVDAAGKLDLKQVSSFLKEIPQVFESIEAIVDGVDEYF